MNPRIIFQFKSVCGVVKRGLHVSIDEGCIRSDIWMIKHEKMGENTQFGPFSESSTGTIEVLPVEYRYWSFLAKFYRYNLGFYR